eukprot:Pgem_evm1s6949
MWVKDVETLLSMETLWKNRDPPKTKPTPAPTTPTHIPIAPTHIPTHTTTPTSHPRHTYISHGTRIYLYPCIHPSSTYTHTHVKLTVPDYVQEDNSKKNDSQLLPEQKVWSLKKCVDNFKE